MIITVAIGTYITSLVGYSLATLATYIVWLYLYWGHGLEHLDLVVQHSLGT